jgi:GTP-binding protein
VSFRREAHVQRGGPDGGDGGQGGDVWLEVSTDLSSLLSFRDHPHRRAADGAHGQGKRRHGRAGKDCVVKVPEGTVVRTLDGDPVADLVRDGQRWLAARGGRGGRGNARFLSNRRRAPSFAEQGEIGEERWLDLELKLIADVALVGYPNVGKSTLISRVSAARPKIAGYPFTTLEPHLGVATVGQYPDRTELVIADVPGLVRGASEGRGLGHRFLRHVERALVLLVMLDLASAEDIPPADQEKVLFQELCSYRPELLERPRVVVGSKADAVPTGRSADWFDGQRVSAVTGEGVAALLGRLASLVGEERRTRPRSDTVIVHRPEPEGLEVVRGRDGAFVVRGRPAERAVAVNDLTDPQALEYVQSRLRRLGVDSALSRAGAREGDAVRIGSLSFTFEPDA